MQENKNNQNVEKRAAYMTYEYIHSWFTQYPKGQFEVSLKTFIAEDAEGNKYPDEKFIIDIGFLDQKPLKIEQMGDSLKFDTANLMDYIILSVRKNSKMYKSAIVSKKILIASLIGNVVDTAISEINHKFKLTDEG